jgi:hypothetical protein
MNTQPVDQNSEHREPEEAVADLSAEPIEIRPAGDAVSDLDFEEVVREALDAVGGTFLFKLRIGGDEEGEHVSVASVGNGDGRQFLVLTLPISGGRLRVETAARSESPVAGIAAAYAGLVEAFATAA